jgi:D-beta-D-heptose 7-phosphate kinase/D-beta-D-heptose 1-phosphate adenosyltransferase
MHCLKKKSRSLKAKIKSLPRLSKIIRKLKKEKKIIVFTNGCFDILHYGHVQYLQDARRKGDLLVVAVNSDVSIRRIKGALRPIVDEQDRIRAIAGLESVDYAVLFNEDTPLNLIRVLKPQVLVKGADWSVKNIIGQDIVRSYGGKVAIVKLIAGRSTTSLIKKIAENFSK